MYANLDATYKDMQQFSNDRAAQALEKPISWVVFDGDKLVAIALRTFYTPTEYYKLFNGQICVPNPKLIIKNDYAEGKR